MADACRQSGEAAVTPVRQHQHPRRQPRQQRPQPVPPPDSPYAPARQANPARVPNSTRAVKRTCGKAARPRDAPGAPKVPRFSASSGTFSVDPSNATRRRPRYHAPRVAGPATGFTRVARNASNGAGPKRVRAREIDDFPDTRRTGVPTTPNAAPPSGSAAPPVLTPTGTVPVPPRSTPSPRPAGRAADGFPDRTMPAPRVPTRSGTPERAPRCSDSPDSRGPPGRTACVRDIRPSASWFSGRTAYRNGAVKATVLRLDGARPAAAGRRHRRSAATPRSRR